MPVGTSSGTLSANVVVVLNPPVMSRQADSDALHAGALDHTVPNNKVNSWKTRGSQHSKTKELLVTKKCSGNLKMYKKWLTTHDYEDRK